MIGKQLFFGKRETKALLIGENKSALSISDCKYNASVMSSDGRGRQGISKEPCHKTKAFQGPT
jgi:hypothetical protein